MYICVYTYIALCHSCSESLCAISHDIWGNTQLSWPELALPGNPVTSLETVHSPRLTTLQHLGPFYSNTPAPFPTLGLCKLAFPSAWKVLPHSSEWPARSDFRVSAPMLCQERGLSDSPLRTKSSFPRFSILRLRPLHVLGSIVAVCDDPFHLFACSLVWYLSPQLEGKFFEVEPVPALLIGVALSPLDSARR